MITHTHTHSSNAFDEVDDAVINPVKYEHTCAVIILLSLLLSMLRYAMPSQFLIFS